MSEAKEEFFSELDKQQAANRQEHQGSCWFLAMYFVFIYLALVFILWNVGRVTHQTNRELTDLYQAQSLTEIRDLLAERFAPFSWWHIPTADQIKGNLVNDLNSTIQNKVDNTSNEIKQQTQDFTNQATSTIQQQATDAAANEAQDQVNQSVDQATNP